MRQIRWHSLLSLALALSLTLPAAAAETDAWLIPPVKDAPAFADTAGTWCETEVAVVCEAGLMEGRSADCFAPGETLMPEHVVAVCARLYSLLTGGNGTVGPTSEGEAWYQPYYDYLAESLDYTGGAEALMLNFHATKYPAKRWHFAELLYQTLEAADAELPVLNQVSVVPDSTDPAVLALYRAGILTGSDPYGTFDGNGILNRGQAPAILARLADPSLRQTFTLQSFDLCADVLGLDADSQAIAIGFDGALEAELSVDIVAPILCQHLERQYGQQTGDPEAVRSAVVEQLWRDLAVTKLAAQQGITVTDEEAEADGSPIVPGFRGMSASAQLWTRSHNLLKSRLLEAYREAGSPSPQARLDRDLDRLMGQMSAQMAPELNTLDLSAVYQRLMASPFPLWNG